ncbi:AAA family ATPase [Methylobacterium hispanicum]|uniref:AAA family ATPase n=1 Tax=Methylobacterium hispanicum TaxID=270350 RepID=UPI002F2BB639
MKKLDKTPAQTLKSLAASTEPEAGSLDEFLDNGAAPRESVATMPVRVILAMALIQDTVPARYLDRIATHTGTAMVVGVPGPDYVEAVGQAFSRAGCWGVTYRRSGASKTGDKPGVGSDEAAQILSAGQNVLGVSHAPDQFLPASLVTAADIRIDLRAPSPRVLRSAIFLVTGRRPRRIPDDAARGLSFEEVSACIRRGSRAGECVRRLAAASKAKFRGDPALADVPTLDRMHGLGPAAEWGLSLAAAVSEWRRNEREWASIDRAAIVSGPPGCGKSSYARALAKTLGMPLVSTSVASWFSSGGYLDQVIAAFDAAVARAVAVSPAVLFIDEIDTIPSRANLGRNSNAEYWNTLVSRILLALDSAVSGETSSLIVLGATNYPERLDDALVRPGRLNRVIRIPALDAPAIAGILRQHLGDDLPDADLMPLAAVGLGASGAEVASWAKGAKETAWAGRRPMEPADLVAQVAPPETRSKAQLLAVARHEASHACSAELLGSGTVESVSIVGRGGFAGRTNARLRTTECLSADELDAFVVSVLCGRAADEHWGSPTSGSAGAPGSDLAIATGLVAGKHASYGLGATLSYRGAPADAAGLLDRDAAFRAVVEADLQNLYACARAFVARNATLIEALAHRLVRSRILSGAEVRGIIGTPASAASVDGSRVVQVGGVHG